MVEAALGIFTSFSLTFSGLAVVNIIFLLAILFRGGSFKDKKIILIGSIFAAWVLFSVLATSFINPQLSLGFRELIQVVFSLQYILLAYKLSVDFERIGIWVARAAVAYSVFILVLLVTSGSFRGFHWEPYLYYELGYGILPGWPNGLSAPLGFALWGVLQKRWVKKYIYSSAFIISAALLITSSRGALLALILIWLYHLWTLKIWLRIPFVIRVVLLCFFVYLAIILILGNATDIFLQSIFRSHDRVDIFDVSIQLIGHSPVFGYGGRTLDQIQYVMPIDLTDQTYPQTHNFILEIALRHGAVGLGLFIAFMIILFKGNLDRDKAFILVVMLILALTQDYIRNFVFLFCLYWLAYSDEKTTNVVATIDHRIPTVFSIYKTNNAHHKCVSDSNFYKC